MPGIVRMKSILASIVSTVLIACLAAGCATAPVRAPQGLPAPVPLQIDDWTVSGIAGSRVVSPHYVIYSTVPDRQLLLRVGELMEGALSAYRSVAPEVPESSRPMECYLFANRTQWAAFTKDHTGEDAAIYLRVNRGGYTIGDWFVAYWIGPIGTYSVAAHEGWHQYVARHLNGRLPPFLEEGLACMFEQVQWDGDLPRWDLSLNTARLVSLRSAVEQNHTFPLSQLVRMHAGQVVGKPSAQIEAFYAQSWAFARFLYDAEGARYRPALRRMLADAARGSLFRDSSRQFPRGPLWDPATARPMLEHYLGTDLERIEREYEQYIRELAAQSGHAASES
jgi:hypothetical protein